MKRQLFSIFILTVAALSAIAPTAKATQFRVRTLQERQGEVIVIEEGTITNFRSLQRSR